MGANDWNIICDASGFKIKASQSVRQWDGAIVDRRFVDRRNPQDFVKGVREDSSVPFARPEGPDIFVGPGDVTVDDL
jgi:hypothetical protein